ncbi:RES family NAD+ phosphorylase [Sphingobium sp. H39-3-25]|uniref:RES family NAD+ phosphorylase n=1 Tax=Sphingomonadales TaxID=204457 RepID=UPI00082A232E|nr:MULTISPECIES: RES family NAD+ phosphorylase [Sphingomonadaceae]MDF0491098.1 RES family NAD+ phosphorylase [Sphingomonas pollutisoli]MDF0545171.1 RES family NAD+ phosphorylase [Sphingobium arseniciresistens]
MPTVRLRRIDAGVRLYRIHRTGHDPIYFGPDGETPLSRYDSPDGSYKVLYAARTLETAFGETLVRAPATPHVLSTMVEARVRSELVTTRPLRLYPLLDAGVSAHGLSFTDLHGIDYVRSWAVCAEIHATTAADGILYTSRFDNRRCVALFDRAAAAIEAGPVSRVSISPSEAAALAGHFGKIYVEP